jgi:hypothetical protein
MSCQKSCPYTVAIWKGSAEINSNVQNLLEQRVKLEHTASKEYFWGVKLVYLYIKKT